MAQILQEGQPFWVDLFNRFFALDADLLAANHVHLAELYALLLFLIEVVLVLALLLFHFQASVVLLRLRRVGLLAHEFDCFNRVSVNSSPTRHVSDVLDDAHLDFLQA